MIINNFDCHTCKHRSQVLVQFPMVPLSDVFELIDAHLVNTHGLKGQEERGAFFGRVFASLALLQSGRLTETVRETIAIV